MCVESQLCSQKCSLRAKKRVVYVSSESEQGRRSLAYKALKKSFATCAKFVRGGATGHTQTISLFYLHSSSLSSKMMIVFSCARRL